jgi:Lon protease-like protein
VGAVTERIPLFPLGTVLFPGLLLPLHIFEDRYRVLVRHLVSLPEGAPRRFGVVCIREGREVGTHGVRSLHAIGCLAELGEVEAYDDGRFDTVSLGTSRFRLLDVDDSLPYLQGDVEVLPELPGEDGTTLAPRVARLFTTYRTRLAAARAGAVELADDLEAALGADPSGDDVELPSEPSVLSYFVAAATVLQLEDKQKLLAAVDDSARLRMESNLLRHESAVLRALPSLPAVDLASGSTSVN